MRNFVVLKHVDKSKTLKHFFGSVYTDRGEAEFYCTFCGKRPSEEKNWEIYEQQMNEESTKNCPHGKKDYIVLKSLNGLEEVLNCGYELVTVIQDSIETDEY